MKLEIPNTRIMRGEAANLSSSASKVLLILIACQDQTTSQIKWSPQALLEITKLSRSTYYEALKELLKKGWIEKKGKSLLISQDSSKEKVRPDGQNAQHQVEKVRPDGQNAQHQVEKVRPDGQNVHPDGLDQIDLDLRSDQIGLNEINTIANFYNLNESEIEQLIEVCKGKSKAGILMIFESMTRKEIKNPLQYIKKSIYNLNGTVTIKKGSPSFFDKYPDFFKPTASRWQVND